MACRLTIHAIISNQELNGQEPDGGVTVLFWGIVLIAIGIGSLFDLSVWPIILIAIGASMISRVLFGSKSKGGWSNWSCWCGPSFRGRGKDDSRRQASD